MAALSRCFFRSVLAPAAIVHPATLPVGLATRSSCRAKPQEHYFFFAVFFFAAFLAAFFLATVRPPKNVWFGFPPRGNARRSLLTTF